MKIEIEINKSARISFSQVPRINPFVSEPILDNKGRPTYEDKWLEIPTAVALALQEIQARLDGFEKVQKDSPLPTVIVKHTRKRNAAP